MRSQSLCSPLGSIISANYQGAGALPMASWSACASSSLRAQHVTGVGETGAGTVMGTASGEEDLDPASNPTMRCATFNSDAVGLPRPARMILSVGEGRSLGLVARLARMPTSASSSTSRLMGDTLDPRRGEAHAGAIGEPAAILRCGCMGVR